MRPSFSYLTTKHWKTHNYSTWKYLTDLPQIKRQGQAVKERIFKMPTYLKQKQKILFIIFPLFTALFIKNIPLGHGACKLTIFYPRFGTACCPPILGLFKKLLMMEGGKLFPNVSNNLPINTTSYPIKCKYLVT
jgi:hypothetical protein